MAKVSFKLGLVAQDTVTGFKGIMVSRHEYISGCIQYNLEAKSKDGGKPVCFYVDEQQIKIVGKGVITEPRPNGGGFREHP